MRHLIRVACAAALLALPLGASAQDEEQGGSRLEQWHPEAFADPSKPSPEEPALQLRLDETGVEASPRQPRTADGYTADEMELRVKRAKIGLGVSGIAMVAGFGVLMGGAAASFRRFPEEPSTPPGVKAAISIGSVTMAGGFVGIIASSVLLRTRERELRELQGAHYGTPRRAQWDLARSRLVF